MVFRGAAEEEVVEVKVELSVRLGTLVVLLVDAAVVAVVDDVVKVSLVVSSVGEITGVEVVVVVVGCGDRRSCTGGAKQGNEAGNRNVYRYSNGECYCSSNICKRPR